MPAMNIRAATARSRSRAMVTVAVTYPLNRQDAVNVTYVRKVRDVIARINRQRKGASERTSRTIFPDRSSAQLSRFTVHEV